MNVVELWDKFVAVGSNETPHEWRTQSKGIFISQQKYTLDLLTETDKLGCIATKTPIEVNHKLGDTMEEAAEDKNSYQRLVGRLIYFSHTKLDIPYAIGVVSQFMHNPKEEHLTLEAYTDVDYAGIVVDRRSTLEYCNFLGGDLITWRSKKQNVVTRSSTEAEFRAMALGVANCCG
ncbi:hypothetical protein GQ457_02G033970 [Hibiscus cannabinus]